MRRPVARPARPVEGGLSLAPSTPEVTDRGAEGSVAGSDVTGLAPLILSPRPVARPARRTGRQTLAIAPYQPPNQSGRSGPVCQDPRLVGTREETILAGTRACGILNPVKIEEVAGVRLSTPATVNCPTARRFADWVTGIAQPAARDHLGSNIRGIWVMGSYVCRTRNHKKGGRISEHGKGRAIDVGGVTLSDGRRITVKDDWGRGSSGAFLKTVHSRACGMFHTVLGPRADRFHKDHFHFDTAQRGGSPYCR
ncbi:MAG: extensin family protein [Pseudomonadota bacterium]